VGGCVVISDNVQYMRKWALLWAQYQRRDENDPDELDEVEDEVDIALEDLRRAEVIQNMMSVTKCLNLMHEEVTDSAEDLEVHV